MNIHTDSITNRVMVEFDRMLKVLNHVNAPGIKVPGDDLIEPELDQIKREHTAGLMRINHTGEVCAQALYHGQAFMAKDESTRAHLLHAAQEEHDHLQWCQSRLDDLGAQASKTNLYWYMHSFAVGSFAALFGDPVSYGFVIETERQVESHLQEHIDDIGRDDPKSLAILAQMQADEIRHGADARDAGGVELPAPIKTIMTGMSKIMKFVSYRI